MNRFLLGCSALLLGFLNTTNITQAQQVPVMEFYHGAECPHCHEERQWFPELKKLYPDLDIQAFEVWHDASNQKRWTQRMTELGMQPTGVPTNIINNEVIVGFKPVEILSVLKRHYGPPVDPDMKISVETKNSEGWKKYLESSWPVMALALGLVDGFNPCAMWTLLILIGFLLTMESKRRRWWIGGVFVGSSAILYGLALLGYLFGFTGVSAWVASSVMGWIFRAVGILAVGTGIFSLRSWMKKSVDCEVRDLESKQKFRSKLEKILAKEKFILVLAGVVGLAFSVNALELLCSFAIPTAFTATLVNLDLPMWKQLTAIGIYDVGYIFDDVLVLFIALWTMSLKVFSPKVVQISHLVGGILLLALGAFLIFDPQFLANLIG
ncbi:hypothetical protein K9L63_00510 [Candidatus Gracilibacteria bacterium]|nr:hypothetical protein [Candidatus Gracilibacteria bacterium]